MTLLDFLSSFLSVISIKYLFVCFIEARPSIDDIFDECIPISTVVKQNIRELDASV